MIDILQRFFNQSETSILSNISQNGDSGEIGIQPSRSLAKTITWTLLGTSVGAFSFLALAKTDEVVVAKGLLHPIGDVKVVQIPMGGVLKEMLVTDGQRVNKEQVLLRLDKEASEDKARRSLQILRAKEAQLQLKQTELDRYLGLNDSRIEVLKQKIELNKTILNRIEKLALKGAAPEIQYLQQLDQVAELEGEYRSTLIVRERQLAIFNQSIQELKGQLAGLKSNLTEPDKIIASTLLTHIGKYREVHPEIDNVSTWELAELYNIQKYEPEQGYHAPHCECMDGTTPRILAWMFYLNTVTDKGGTHFTNYDITTDAVEGRLVIWPAYWTHTHHGIASPTQIKYIATGWYEFAQKGLQLNEYFDEAVKQSK